METNRDLEATWEYHEGTKHSFQSVHSSRHFLDFENQPLPFKIYTGLEPISLPQGLEPSGVPALEALAASAAEPEGDRLPDLKLLARLLKYSAGITKRRRYSHGEMLFRAASCTGALYHIDLYLVCADLPYLEAGVYHFGVHDFALRQLRRGDFRGELVRATASVSPGNRSRPPLSTIGQSEAERVMISSLISSIAAYLSVGSGSMSSEGRQIRSLMS